MSYHCFNCNSELQLVDGRAGRGDYCFKCRSDVHCCMNCKHYDTSAYNDCHEPQAERVVDKTKSNFCDYFVMKQGGSGAKVKDPKKEQLGKLDDLFKK